MTKLYKNGKVILENRIIETGAVLTENGVIKEMMYIGKVFHKVSSGAVRLDVEKTNPEGPVRERENQRGQNLVSRQTLASSCCGSGPCGPCNSHAQ